MATEIKAPVFPESVADGTIATWHKKVGEPISRDEVICDIETDKVVLEVVAPADGSLVAIIKGEGDTVLSDEVIAQFEAGAVSAAPEAAAPAAADAGRIRLRKGCRRRPAQPSAGAVELCRRGPVRGDPYGARWRGRGRRSTDRRARAPGRD